jgi:YegS/Rv2252/BmrU family lipid kinase
MTDTSLDENSKIFVVLNPVAGTTDAETVHTALAEHFGEKRYTYEVHETSGEENVPDVVRRAIDEGYNLFIAAGGDGTVSGVLDGAASAKLPVAILPIGTMNTFARDLGIPLNLDKALDVLAGEHEVRSIDAMKVGKRFFVLNVSVGISSYTMRHTQRADKRRFGFLAYAWQTLRWLFGFQPRRFIITADEKTSQPQASEVVVANSGLIGLPPFRWGSQISMDDGTLDICIVHARTAPDYIRLLWGTVVGQRNNGHEIRYMTAERSVTINSDQALPVQADGELIGDTPVQVQLVPNAVRVIVPVNDRQE